MKTISKPLSIIAGVCLLVGILLRVVLSCSFDIGFYEKEYAKYHQAEYIRMSDEKLMESTTALLDYIQDQRDDIVVIAEVNGIEREVFDERETLHMVDVKNLYQFANRTGFILLFGGILILGILIFRNRKGYFTILRDAFIGGFLTMAIFLMFIGIYAFVDFDGFWLNFHYVFFDNDLFLLDPNVSIMINMFPENFFFDLVVKIIVRYIAVLAVIGCVLFLIYRKKRKELYDQCSIV